MERAVKGSLNDKVGIREYLEDWGIELVYIIAGALGGLLMVLKKTHRKRPWWEKGIIILVGMLTANYVTPLITWLFNIPEGVHHAIAFLLGYMGLEAVGKLIDIARDRLKKK